MRIATVLELFAACALHLSSKAEWACSSTESGIFAILPVNQDYVSEFVEMRRRLQMATPGAAVLFIQRLSSEVIKRVGEQREGDH